MTHLNPKFAELGVRDEIVRALAEDGKEHPFAIQELTLPLALAGDDLIGQADRLRLSEIHLKSDDPLGKADALAHVLGCERIGPEVEVGETLVRFTPGGPQGRPELEAEMFV